MIVRSRLCRAKRTAQIAVAPLAGLAAAAVAFISPDIVVVSAFNTAISNTATASLPATVTANTAPVAGSEDYWLRQQGQATPAGFSGPISVGDKISFGAGGAQRDLEVLEVRAVDGVTRIDTATGPLAEAGKLRQLVICKDPSKTGAEALVHLMVEPETPASRLSAARSRAL